MLAALASSSECDFNINTNCVGDTLWFFLFLFASSQLFSWRDDCEGNRLFGIHVAKVASYLQLTKIFLVTLFNATASFKPFW